MLWGSWLSPVFGKVRLPHLFGDHMVLQRDQNLHFWGWADPGEEVSIAFAGQAETVFADSHGQWSLQLDPVSAGGPPTLTVTGMNKIEEPSNYVIAQNVSDQFSVIKENDVYYLITHEPYFGRRIWIMQSDSPTGPWINKRTIYCTPENTDNIFTYNSFVHPELSVDGELRISYNINSFNFNDLFMNADLYRPKFIRIDNWN